MALLPPEILAEIFRLASSPKRLYYNVKEAPWTTAQVCHRWRDICLSTPKLWAEFSAQRTLDLDLDRHLTPLRFLASTYLQRSLDSNLMITLDDVHPAHEDMCMQLLWLRRGSWKSFTIWFSEHPAETRSWFHRALLAHGSGADCVPLQALRVLAIHTLKPDLGAVRTQAVLEMFSNCPVLSYLSLGNMTCADLPAPSSFPDPLGRIRTFDAQLYNPKTVALLLPRLTNLTLLSLSLAKRPLCPQRTTFHLPHLLGLSIGGPAPLDFLDAFRTPSLRFLSLHKWNPGLLSLIQLSACRIRHLDIRVPDGATLLALLSQTPHLTHLHAALMWQSDIDIAISALQGGPSNQADGNVIATNPLCPQLSSLLLRDGQEAAVQRPHDKHILTSIADLVESRQSSSWPLKIARFTIRQSAATEEGMGTGIERLLDLGAQGVDVDVAYRLRARLPKSVLSDKPWRPMDPLLNEVRRALVTREELR
ncbi:hypothetical protein BDV98DRAFT_570891 [Pterulicium gracile]|uniref:Uncharacterized protein n=1 Tax=Pterulicium gracile TaxID=1884261 RepID=A0A5C3QCZ3_9AGAR|nr:hypothetical protein BDV98DRAFT_570891 [Pterula gracilis]